MQVRLTLGEEPSLAGCSSVPLVLTKPPLAKEPHYGAKASAIVLMPASPPRSAGKS